LLHGSTAMARHQLAPYLEQCGEVSLVSGEVSLEDFAFADTVAVQDLPIEAMPASYRDPYPTILDDERSPARPGSLRAWLSFYQWQRGRASRSVDRTRDARLDRDGQRGRAHTLSVRQAARPDLPWPAIGSRSTQLRVIHDAENIDDSRDPDGSWMA